MPAKPKSDWLYSQVAVVRFPCLKPNAHTCPNVHTNTRITTINRMKWCVYSSHFMPNKIFELSESPSFGDRQFHGALVFRFCRFVCSLAFRLFCSRSRSLSPSFHFKLYVSCFSSRLASPLHAVHTLFLRCAKRAFGASWLFDNAAILYFQRIIVVVIVDVAAACKTNILMHV